MISMPPDPPSLNRVPPVIDNIFGIFNDRKLGYSIGPSMGLGSWQQSVDHLARLTGFDGSTPGTLRRTP